MTSQTVSTAASARPSLASLIIRFGVTLLIVGGFITFLLGARGLVYLAHMIANAHLHAPDWGLIARAQPAIQIHLATVLAAFALATVQLVGPKGSTAHRVLGWTLSILLLFTAVASLFIHDPRGNLFNPFQVFSIWTLIAVPWALISARRHNVRRHAAIMTGFYMGGLVIAGLLTFLPGRLMWRVFFG